MAARSALTAWRQPGTDTDDCSNNETRPRALRAGHWRLWHRHYRVHPDGATASHRPGRGGEHPQRRSADHRLCHWRDGRRADHDLAVQPLWEARCADGADGHLHPWQPAVVTVAGLLHPARFATGHQPQPWCVLRPGSRGGSQRGAQGKTGQRRGHHVHGPDHRQHRRRTGRHLDRPADRLAHGICRYRRTWPAGHGRAVVRPAQG